MKQIRKTFNDGFLTYGTKVTQRSERGKNLGQAFQSIGQLAFNQMSCREQDYQLAHSMTKSLDLKVETPNPVHLDSVKKSNLLVRIGGIEYDVIKTDVAKDKTSIYFYLQEVGASVTNDGATD